MYSWRHQLPTITAWPIERCLQFFDSLQLEGRRGEIADKIVKEVTQRLQFLVNVGLDYLTLDRKRGNAVRGRGAAHPAGQPDRRRTGRRDVHPR